MRIVLRVAGVVLETEVFLNPSCILVLQDCLLKARW